MFGALPDGGANIRADAKNLRGGRGAVSMRKRCVMWTCGGFGSRFKFESLVV